ncbi:unnamed protein product, partial [Ixodes hexagonus]
TSPSSTPPPGRPAHGPSRPRLFRAALARAAWVRAGRPKYRPRGLPLAAAELLAATSPLESPVYRVPAVERAHRALLCVLRRACQSSAATFLR